MHGLRACSIGAMVLNMFTWPWHVEGPLCYLLDELLKPRFSPWQWFITWKFMPLMQSGCPVQLGLISYDVPRVGVHYSDTCVILGPKISLLCRLVKTVRVVSSVASRNLSKGSLLVNFPKKSKYDCFLRKKKPFILLIYFRKNPKWRGLSCLSFGACLCSLCVCVCHGQGSL